MRDDDDEGWTEREREAFAALPRRATPPPDLEERVVAGLKARGMICAANRWSKAAVAAFIVVLLPLAFVAGLRAGAARGAGPSATFALLIYDPVGAASPAQVRAAVDEAIAWAGELGENGVLVVGEKLGDSGLRLTMRDGRVARLEAFPSAGTPEVLGGFFLIHADDYEHARSIASTCPLLRYGSTIEVRAIEEL